jgi:uncharacterized lipoprotein YajG
MLAVFVTGRLFMRKLMLLLAIAVTAAACAPTRITPLSVPLIYTQNPRNAGQVGPLSCNAIAALSVRDARTSKLLGTRTLEGKSDSADVNASNDVAAWAQSGVQSFLTQNGITVGSRGPRVEISLDSLSTSENVWHRSSYRAGLALTARVVSPSGKMCFQNTSQGKGGNYGYSGSNENYQETLNEALDDATQQLATLPAFKDALCQCAD